jgi:hypothetical protein
MGGDARSEMTAFQPMSEPVGADFRWSWLTPPADLGGGAPRGAHELSWTSPDQGVAVPGGPAHKGFYTSQGVRTSAGSPLSVPTGLAGLGVKKPPGPPCRG